MVEVGLDLLQENGVELAGMEADVFAGEQEPVDRVGMAAGGAFAAKIGSADGMGARRAALGGGFLEEGQSLLVFAFFARGGAAQEEVVAREGGLVRELSEGGGGIGFAEVEGPWYQARAVSRLTGTPTPSA